VFVERDHLHASPRGVVLAVASGAIASGLGYAIWYAALRHVSASRAAIAQLIVPVLAALGGVLVLREAPSARLFVCGAVVLCGVAIAIAPRAAATPRAGERVRPSGWQPGPVPRSRIGRLRATASHAYGPRFPGRAFPGMRP